MTDDSALWQAYRDTTYIATPDQGEAWQVRVDERSPVAGPMAFLTSQNPASVALSHAENKRLLDDLQSTLQKGAYHFWPGHTLADDGNWPREDGFWIHPISKKRAIALARHYRQNAILFVPDHRREVLLVDCRI